MIEKVNIIGIPIAASSLDRTIEFLQQHIQRKHQPGYITVTGAHGIIESYYNRNVRLAHLNAMACVPDGMPLSWFGWIRGFKQMDRVYGPDLMLAALEMSAKNGFLSFLYGSSPGVCEELINKVKLRIPGLRIAGHISPPFRPLDDNEENSIIESINNACPDIIWIGLSTPKQELLMKRWKGRIQAPLMIGVGAAFDFLSGGKKQAPKWIQRSGLEWFFRLCTEPGRLWKRYFFIVPAFLILAFLQLTGLRKFDSGN